ncbi:MULTISPECIES: tRNA glutamyl-Q(34) synthetase GluQRS [unclassified Caulobacter]|uniref:tRNA glutamyl-Q(34) synthetase GluQRS n=1 Tax=unclassified Caulobacter TaxID=2648921 RepID=UPI000781C91D|nr:MULTISPECIES: tRNA glutamyl-Q(34) synthetase GluQRS [unclassified Caulobacter]AZS21993.1 tRNA glutamyl-Q(34) synthetase GluQRS [Caulobacter sp. FWC26]
MTFVTRFAPSPTGYLHRGHAYSALTTFEAARAAGGRFILRIEDIDATRCRPEYEAAILEDLAWLGLRWETPARRQSEHLSDYEAAIAALRDRGLVYRCFKTRKEIDIGRAPHEPAVAYVGAPLSAGEEAERLARGEPFAWRLSLAAAREALGGFDSLTFVEEGVDRSSPRTVQARPETAGDIVLARKDVGVAYHLAVVHDDALQGVTHVIRGEDLFEATHIQRLLQALLGLPTPVYRHHGLLTGPDGKRYAKRDKAQTLRALRASGMTASALRAELGFE